jgi:hypothetical protein
MNAGAWGSADAGRLTPEPSRWKSGRVAMSGNLGLCLLPPLALELGRGQVVGRIMETLVVPPVDPLAGLQLDMLGRSIASRA